MEDPRSTPEELVKGPLTSPKEWASPRLYRRMEDLRSNPDELVRGP
jgi:hypothetical protein